MRLFFFAHLSSEERKAIAVKQLDSAKQISTQLEAVRPEIQMRADRFQYLCFEFGTRFFDDLARNLAQVLDALDEEKVKDIT